ncbi:MAG: sensor histidine kinase [Dehalococcoidales bacterium]|nr:sensor histidine kinase [Dehalococcoidales bacterium]
MTNRFSRISALRSNFLRLNQTGEISFNIHFWLVIVSTALIAVLYYSWQYWFPWFWRYFAFEYLNRILGVPFIIFPFFYACFKFGWRGSLLAWFIIILTLTPLFFQYYLLHREQIVLNIGFLTIPLAVVLAAAFELYWREEQKQRMQEREKERQDYLAKTLSIQENERQRIAQELHDDSIQELYYIASTAQNIASDINNPGETRRQAVSMNEGIIQVMQGIRNIIADLRPSILDDIGLIPALRWLIQHVFQNYTIDAGLVVNGTIRKFSPDKEMIIFRIVQEALSNVRKHANAAKVTLTLTFATDGLDIEISDDGKGFNKEEMLQDLSPEGKLGIYGMSQRAQLINGTLELKSATNKGTTVLINNIK